ncbi:TIGR01620 family protein [Epibacterium sp. SM1969]|uniref:TIGR01620 family protein n=1 Tax=Tritonibacter aquimaris TaxID=2663379 RepID=A0A844ARC3_9RHOB|nr:TIGR01620 family protein [Tritonibacter aquimaris]MQY42217.1 TIGR01620 family protein [Tritonibacter aquimaris]
MSNKPVLFELDDAPSEAPKVADAPPVEDPLGAALHDGEIASEQTSVLVPVATHLARGGSRLGRLFWSVLVSLAMALISFWAWEFVTGLITNIPLLGWLFAAGFALLIVLALVFVLRELAGIARLKRVDQLRQSAQIADQDLAAAHQFANQLMGFYRGRDELDWARQNLKERLNDTVDAPVVLDLAEAELLSPLDAQALAEVEAAARQVATVTALVPLALADVIVALTASVRMIRRIGAIYGGRSGGVAAWRLIRRVFAHLVATGAMAVGDDLLEPLLGGSILSKLSRRFGEGLVNGALTARVGLAAMDLCRPMPFSDGRRPKTRQVIQNALKGIVSRGN